MSLQVDITYITGLCYYFTLNATYFYSLRAFISTTKAVKNSPSSYISVYKLATNKKLLWNDIGDVVKKHLVLALKLRVFVLGSGLSNIPIIALYP